MNKHWNSIKSDIGILQSLKGNTFGIEKESLRVCSNGKLAHTPHPKTLGCPLTHKYITTDYSEAQLELVTNIHNSPQACVDELSAIHTFTQQQLEEEILWHASMPCAIPSENHINIASYGPSNEGRIREVYRKGLHHRYGSTMQTICGLHYNFGLAEKFWEIYQQITQQDSSIQTFINEQYFHLIRNFQAQAWVIIYLFGSSPAISDTFLPPSKHKNYQTSTANTLILPYATSLRMSPIGYQNDTQSNVHISYNSLNEYITTLYKALVTEAHQYQNIPISKNGEYNQLTQCCLQIENELYGIIRPKQSLSDEQRPIEALANHGVEYLEIRCLDIDTYSELGVTHETAHFMEVFLLQNLFNESERHSKATQAQSFQTLIECAKYGRDPTLKIHSKDSLPLRQHLKKILENCMDIAKHLDKAFQSNAYEHAVQLQFKKMEEDSTTPSAIQLNQLEANRSSFTTEILKISKERAAIFRNKPISPTALKHLQKATEASEKSHLSNLNTEEAFEQYLQKRLKITLPKEYDALIKKLQ